MITVAKATPGRYSKKERLVTQQQQPSRQHIANLSETERIRYATLLVEVIINVDHLVHMHTHSAVDTIILKQDKQEILAQIDQLTEYLQGLRSQVEVVPTGKEEQHGNA